VSVHGYGRLATRRTRPLAQKLLEVPPELIETALGLELQDGTVIADHLDHRRCIFLARLCPAEREIAAKLKALANGRPPWPETDADKAINSGAVPVVRLTEMFRQAAESRIVTNAHRLNHALMPDLATAEGGDFYFVDAADLEAGISKLLTIVRERIPKRFGLARCATSRCSAR